MFRKPIAVALSFLTAVSPVLSYADTASTYTVKIPTASVPFVATTATYDFGKVLVGQAPQRTFTFTNTGTDPTTFSSVTAVGGAQVISNTCTGTLAAAQSCSFTAALNVKTTGPNIGQVQVAHSANATPNVYSLTATGITADGLIAPVEPTLSFGDVLVRSSSAPLTANFKNIGTTPLDIMDVGLAEGGANFQVDGSACGTLQPDETCPVYVTFAPQYLGMIQGRLKVTLGDGTMLNMTGLVGNGVQGTPAWSTSLLNYLDIPVGATSAAQSVTLTNSGRGALTLGKLFINGDSSFKIASTTCGATLAVGASCTVSVTNTPLDATIRSAVLELDSTNSSLTVSRVQLYARPVSSKAVLTVSPLALDFGSLPVGQTKTGTLTLQSTGTLAANVSAYTLSGTNAADFTILNAPTCTGSLAPGQQCVLQVQVKPSSAGARSASLAITADTPDAVPSVPLTANGTVGTLAASTASLNFGNVETGKSATLTSTITNAGQAGVTISAATLGVPTAGFTTSGCVGQTLAAGASCTLTVTFAPTTTGAKSSGLALVNTGTPAALPLTLSGNGTAPLLPTATLSDFTCPSPIAVNDSFKCSGTLTNTSALAVTVTAAGLKTDNPAIFGTPALDSSCTGTVAPGATCKINVAGKATAAGTYTANVTVPTNAGTLTSKAAALVSGLSLTLTTTANPPTTVNTVSTVTNTVTNTGTVTAWIPGVSLATTVAVTQPTQQALFAKQSTTCEGNLAPGASCTVTTTFVPYAAGTFSATLNVKATTVSGGTTLMLSQPLSGTSTVPASSSSDIVITPSPVDFGSVWVSASKGATAVVKNIGKGNVTLTGFSVANQQSSVMTYATNLPTSTCSVGFTLAPGYSCLLALTATATTKGVANGLLTVTSNAGGGASTTANITGTGAAGSLAITPSPLDFGVVTATQSLVKGVLLSNSDSQYPLTVRRATISGTDAALFAPAQVTGTGNTCVWTYDTKLTAFTTTLNAGQSCSDYYQYAPTKGGTVASATATYVLSQGWPTVVTLPLMGSASTQPLPAADLSDFTCTSPVQVRQAYTCTATLRSVGTAPLSVTGRYTQSNALFGTPTSNCPASLAVGASCTITIAGTFTTAGPQTDTVSPEVVAPPVSKTFSLVVSPASVTLTTVSHGNVQVGATGTATHTVTNNGTGPVTASVSSPYLVSGAAYGFVSKTCGATLAPGASCTYTTRCTPPSVGPQTGGLQVLFNEAGPLSPLTCTGQAASASVVAAGSLSPDVGGYSRSGNWYRIRNNGVGPMTIQGFFPSDANWTLFTDATNAAHCSLNKVVQPGQDCLVMEVLTTGAPGNVFTGTQRVRTSAGDMTWGSSMKTYGVTVQPVAAFPAVQTGSTAAQEFKVTNLAPFSLGAIKPTLTGTGFTISSTTCTTLAPAGQAGSVCSVFVTYTAPATATTASGTLSITGGYPQIINGAQNLSVGAGIQGTSAAFTVSVVAPKLTLTMGTYPNTLIGSSSDTVSTLRNDGVAAVTMTGAPYLSAGSAHSILSTTCSGSLAPGLSCEVRTRFSPTSAAGATATLTIPTSVKLVSGTLVGALVAQSDVSVSVVPSAAQVFVQGTASFNTTVKNGVGGPATIAVQLNDAASGGASVTARTAPTCTASTGGTCTVSGSTATIVLPANGSAVLNQTLTFGTVGTVAYTAAISPSSVQDPVLSNNTATASVQVVMPLADLSVTWSGLPSQVVTGAASTVDLIIKNNSTGAMAAKGANGKVMLTGSAVGGAVLNTTGVTCPVVSAGATCNASTGMVYLPAGGSVTARVAYNVSGTTGNISFNATVDNYSAGVTDPVLSNNAASAGATVAYPNADLSIQFLTGLPANMFFGSTGTITLRLKNNSLGVTAAPVVTGNADMVGTLPFTVTSATCANMTAGVSCGAGAKTVVLPAGGSVDVTVAFTVGNTGGQLIFTGTLQDATPATTDPVLTNNTAKSSASMITPPVYRKACYFASDKNLGGVNQTIGSAAWLKAYVMDYNSSVAPKALWSTTTGQQTGVTSYWTIKGTNVPAHPVTGVVYPSGGGLAGFGAYVSTGGKCFLSETPVSACLSTNGYTMYHVAGYTPTDYITTNMMTPYDNTAWVESSSQQMPNKYYMMWSEVSPAYDCQAPGSSTAFRSTTSW